jgi:hypothetical protein
MRIISTILLFVPLLAEAQLMSTWSGDGSTSTLLNGLVAYYSLEETAGVTAYDSHASYDGSHQNTPTMDSVGQVNKCYYFEFLITL